MALVSDSIPSLINGVSQQAETLRLASQADEQVNFMSSVVDGLTKRPPTYHIAKLIDGSLGEASLHLINRDTSERYLVIMEDDDLRVFDVEGDEKTVAFPDGKGYLNAAAPSSAFRAVTISDYTFILNQEITTSMDATSVPTSRGVEAIVFIKQANYSTDYNITVDAYTASVTTDDDDDPDPLSTSDIAQDLKDLLDANLTGFTVTREGPVLWIRKADKSGFTIKTEDSRSGTQMSVAKDQVQRLSELPTIAPAGFVTEVIGDETSSFDNYYVVFQPNNGAESFDTGVWVETVAPEIEVSLDATTMPHGLIREGDGSFTFQALDWGDRTVGNEESAPNPSFIGNKINDIFFFRNRLGFLADENVIMSKSRGFFQFFPSTVTTIVDDDPIDVSASHTKVSILNHAIPFNETLLLFSDQTQFLIDDESLLASRPPGIKAQTEFESSVDAKPVGSGRNIFFATKKGDFSGVREYSVIDDNRNTDASDITGHVPKYIPEGVFKLSAATNEDILFALTSAEPNRIYVYKYYWSELQKLQSSWSYWEIDGAVSILNSDFIDTDAYLAVQYPDGVYLMRQPVDPGRTDANAPFEYLLDRKISEAGVLSSYNAIADQTTFTVPYQIHGTVQVISRYKASYSEGDRKPGIIAQQVSASGTDVIVKGDWTTTPVFIGEKYNARYTPTPPQMKQESQSGGRAVVTDGRLQILRYFLVYDNTGFFKVDVNLPNGTAYEYKYTGKQLGALSSIIGGISLDKGEFSFPVQARNDRFVMTVSNDTFLPSTFTSAAWRGNFTSMSRRR